MLDILPRSRTQHGIVSMQVIGSISEKWLVNWRLKRHPLTCRADYRACNTDSRPAKPRKKRVRLECRKHSARHTRASSLSKKEAEQPSPRGPPLPPAAPRGSRARPAGSRPFRRRPGRCSPRAGAAAHGTEWANARRVPATDPSCEARHAISSAR